jgi:hypothetical protein
VRRRGGARLRKKKWARACRARIASGPHSGCSQRRACCLCSDPMHGGQTAGAVAPVAESGKRVPIDVAPAPVAGPSRQRKNTLELRERPRVAFKEKRPHGDGGGRLSVGACRQWETGRNTEPRAAAGL